jgi:hypothetical protein
MCDLMEEVLSCMERGLKTILKQVIAVVEKGSCAKILHPSHSFVTLYGTAPYRRLSIGQ